MKIKIVFKEIKSKHGAVDILFTEGEETLYAYSNVQVTQGGILDIDLGKVLHENQQLQDHQNSEDERSPTVRPGVD